MKTPTTRSAAVYPGACVQTHTSSSGRERPASIMQRPQEANLSALSAGADSASDTQLFLLIPVPDRWYQQRFVPTGAEAACVQGGLRTRGGGRVGLKDGGAGVKVRRLVRLRLDVCSLVSSGRIGGRGIKDSARPAE